MSAAHAWLAILACTLPIAFTACVIVNINGSMDSELARSCLGVDRQAKEAACPPCRSGDKSAVNVKMVRESSSSTKASMSRNRSSSEDNSSLFQIPQLRKTICIFISGFSFAVGLILICLLRLGDLTGRRALASAMAQQTRSSSESSQESGSPLDSCSSVRAEHGSNLGPNYRPAGVEGRTRQQDRPVSGKSSDLPASHRYFASRSEPTRVCRETAFTSTPATSMVELGPEEFWL